MGRTGIANKTRFYPNGSQQYQSGSKDGYFRPNGNEVQSGNQAPAVAVISTVDVLGVNSASVRPVEAEAARLLARPILQEYDAFHS
ncbi:MAG TPA: hypothetical protein VM260_08730 [Pirellula sp.]|nr:hypothetical protein [Pirellula sp.]